MHRVLLPTAIRSWTSFLVGLVVPIVCFGQGGEFSPGGEASQVLSGQGQHFSELPPARLWQPTSPWESALPTDPVVGSWEAARLWELYDQKPMLVPAEKVPLSAKASSSSADSFAWPGASPTRVPGKPQPALPDPGPLFPAPKSEGPVVSPEPKEKPPQLVAPGVSPQAPKGPELPASRQAGSSGKAKQEAPASESGTAEEKKTPQEPKHAPAKKQSKENDSQSAEEVPAGEAKVDVEPQSTSWFAWPPVLEHWNARFKAGMDGTAGNNQRFTTRLGLDVDHKDPRFVWSSQLDYVVTTSAGQQIENEAIWDGRFERLTKDSPTGWFVHSNVEYDRFTAFDVRVTLDGGLSYYFLRDPDLSFKGRMAGGTSREFGVPGAEYIPEFSYGLELQWKPHKRYELKAKTDVFSDVRDFSDFRATTRATWRVQVDSSDRVGLQFELLNRYDSTPNGKKKYDLTYSVQLVWDL